MRNMFVSYRGGAISRAGTAFVGRCKQQPPNPPPRLITFQFSVLQGYALEFGELYMRVISNGAYVLEAAKTITGVTQANPAVVTSAGHGFVNGDWVFITGVLGMTQLNGNTYIVAGAAANTFQLHDLDGNVINSTAYGAYTSGGTAARLFTLTTPYAAADLDLLKFAQSADVMSLTHQSYPPQDLTRLAANNWTLTPTAFSAVITAPTTITASATVPATGTPTYYQYEVTAIATANGEESVASPIAYVNNSVDIAATAGSILISWSPVAGALSYNIYKAPPSYGIGIPFGSIFGYAAQSIGIQYVDNNVTPDFAKAPPLHLNPFAPGKVLNVILSNNGSGYTSPPAVFVTSGTGSGAILAPIVVNGFLDAVFVIDGGHDYAPGDPLVIAGGGGSGAAGNPTIGPATGTYPGVVAYFQQRRVYASTIRNPDTYWMSQPGAFKNFDAGIPVSDSDAITGTPWSQQVNGIQFLVPMPGGLVVLTGLGAWQVTGAGGSSASPVGITPSNQQAIPQAFNGCNDHVPPVVVNYDILYVQSRGAIVRDLAYNFFVNVYTGSDLTVLSTHLFVGHQIVQWSWAEEPYKVMWTIRDDGTMLSLTYLKEQEVYAWGRHDTQGQFLSTCSVVETPVNAPYFIVQRKINGVARYYSERMNNRIWSSIEDSWCVDCGLALPQPAPNATLSPAASTGTTILFTASSAVFAPGDVSKIIHIASYPTNSNCPGGGKAIITAYVSGTQVRATINIPIPPVPYTTVPGSYGPGDWTMTAPVTTITGLDHLEGASVVALADGLPLSGLTVTGGSIELPHPATSVVVGLAFLPQLQSVYLDPPSAGPTTQGRRKRVFAVTARINASCGVKIGANQADFAASNATVAAPWTNLKLVGPAVAGGGINPALFTGDEWLAIPDTWKKPAQISAQQDYPLPMEILALIPETLEGDLPETAYTPEDRRDGKQSSRGPGMWMLSS